MDGAADVAETTLPFQSEPDAAPVRLSPAGEAQTALFAPTYARFIRRDGDTELEAYHRRHAEICHPRYGVGLNHLPSGTLAANGAWLAVQVMAHNGPLDRGLGLGEGAPRTKHLPISSFTRSAATLRLWPWENHLPAVARLSVHSQPDGNSVNADGI